jgi:phage-related protein
MYRTRYIAPQKGRSVGEEAKRIPSSFFRTRQGAEPVRNWLKNLGQEDRRKIGADTATVEFGWPVGMPTCRPMGSGLWEVRTNLAHNRLARVIFCIVEDRMVLLHGFLKKTEQTPRADIALARTRMKEVSK